MGLKAAFIFIAPKNDYKVHRAVVAGPVVELHVVGVENYAEGIIVATELEAQGITAFELCGGFGIDGAAQIKKAVSEKCVVGVVRFDGHPGFENKSGDVLFQ